MDEKRVLAEMEQALRRQDRRFATRMDRMNTTCSNAEQGRFTRDVSRKELTLLVLATVMTAVLMGVMTVILNQT
ncbi:DUF3040 domain-containing protein [Herbidospora mongoliensis]|uniref:DUF3040 domain-containing protein n=1 Tax=Herbidospora mongoliensis TaxID=688067 RepID=UPI00082C75F8|nr:DUF3040 domain-containing protein [Herbidospora mongoliensis]